MVWTKYVDRFLQNICVKLFWNLDSDLDVLQTLFKSLALVAILFKTAEQLGHMVTHWTIVWSLCQIGPVVYEVMVFIIFIVYTVTTKRNRLNKCDKEKYKIKIKLELSLKMINKL